MGEMFGNGYAEWRVGKPKFKPYSADVNERFPNEKAYLGIKTQEFMERLTLKTHFTENMIETQQVFSGIETYNQYIQAQHKSVLDWYYLRQLDFLFTIFGVDPSLRPAYDLKDSDSEYKLAKEWASKITNKSTYDVSSTDKDNEKLEKMVQHLNRLVSDMTIAPTSKYYMDPTVENKEEYPVSIKAQDLYLVISNKDKVDFDINTRSGLFNSNLFNFPNIEIIELPIPQGTSYILHKNSIRIAPVFTKQYQQFFESNLDIEHYYYWQTQYGLSRWLPFIKVEANVVS